MTHAQDATLQRLHDAWGVERWYEPPLDPHLDASDLHIVMDDHDEVCVHPNGSAVWLTGPHTGTST